MGNISAVLELEQSIKIQFFQSLPFFKKQMNLRTGQGHVDELDPS